MVDDPNSRADVPVFGLEDLRQTLLYLVRECDLRWLNFSTTEDTDFSPDPNTTVAINAAAAAPVQMSELRSSRGRIPVIQVFQLSEGEFKLRRGDMIWNGSEWEPDWILRQQTYCKYLVSRR